ncbi:hypothetical protein [Antrihabitans spumae]|uniref:Uncharacterized protein n=1 Tax=Antrihabitans spumae TaxID=3373370 RepID=A0ABW7JL05_9NOCA
MSIPATRLPPRDAPGFVANNWTFTWVGFDGLLVVKMATTAALGWKRRQLLVLTGLDVRLPI